MRLTVLLFCLLFILQLPAFSKITDTIKGVPITTNIPSSVYNAGSQNWSITQDFRGYMYFANNFGLLEFNGRNWNTYKLNKANSNLLSVKAIDKRIYVGGQKEFGYFQLDSANQLFYTSLSDELPKDIEFDEVWNIQEGKSNEIYFIAHDFIFRYNNEYVTAIQTVEKTRYSYYMDGYIFSSNNELGIEKYIPLTQERKKIQNSYFLKGKNIRQILRISKNEHMIFTLEGEIYLEKNNVLLPVAQSLWSKFNDAMINTATLLTNNRIAIGTQNAGIFILSENYQLIDHIDTTKGLTDIIVYSLFLDKQDNLWVAHRNGLSYIELESPFKLINKNAGVEGGGYAACISNDRLYLGTSNGLFVEDVDNVTGEKFAFKSITEARGHTYFIEEVNGKLFHAQHLGLYEIQKDKSLQINKEIGAWNTIALNDTHFLQGGYNGLYLLEKTKNSKWKTKKIPGFKESSRLIYIEPGQKTIWVSHGFKGVYKISFDPENYKILKVRHYGENDGFFSNVLINLFYVRNELIFCGERGVFIYDEPTDKFKLHPLYTKLLGTETRISSMASDYDDNVFFIQDGKLGMIKNINAKSPFIERNIFGRINHLVSDDLETIIPINKQHVLFTAKEGFIDYNPRFQRAIHKQVPVSLVSFNSSDGLESKNELNNNSEENITIPYDRNNIDFEFVASYYDGMQFNKYETYLIGFDKQPNPWSIQNSVKYTNLKEGNYQLRIKGKNIYGEESAPIFVNFTISPPWSRSIYAYVLYLFIGILLTIGVVLASRWSFLHRVKSLLGEKQIQLENKDIEIQRLKEKQLEQDLDHKNKELALSTVHLTQRNELLNSLKSDLQRILEKINKGNFSKVRTYDALELIINRIGKDINDEKEWSRFEDHFNLLHSDFFKILKKRHPDLNTQELKICAYIRMNLSSKEMASAMNISLRGVETSRYRLRKKLGLDRHESLTEFIENITHMNEIS
ncbi:triple tyrosine motif-containing protein [Flammeovirga sp. SubArs3]|uniref:triple tyrosine motif-containing protein n=1 Tax=Flammeovirga sp. SubArs3 TaxID=2995316 RepID=UPI00248BC4C1|nr:triple tyrosine motif-containing protein [Flammeovirga sp. SubArs3]